MVMVKWMCGTKFKISSAVLRARLGIDSICVQQGRLRWYGHIVRKDNDSWVKKITNLNTEGQTHFGPLHA